METMSIFEFIAIMTLLLGSIIMSIIIVTNSNRDPQVEAYKQRLKAEYKYKKKRNN